MSGEEEREHKVDVCDEGRSGGEGKGRDENAIQASQVKSKTRNSKACMCRWRGVTVELSCATARIYLF